MNEKPMKPTTPRTTVATRPPVETAEKKRKDARRTRKALSEKFISWILHEWFQVLYNIKYTNYSAVTKVNAILHARATWKPFVKALTRRSAGWVGTTTRRSSSRHGGSSSRGGSASHGRVNGGTRLQEQGDGKHSQRETATHTS